MMSHFTSNATRGPKQLGTAASSGPAPQPPRAPRTAHKGARAPGAGATPLGVVVAALLVAVQQPEVVPPRARGRRGRGAARRAPLRRRRLRPAHPSRANRLFQPTPRPPAELRAAHPASKPPTAPRIAARAARAPAPIRRARLRAQAGCEGRGASPAGALRGVPEPEPGLAVARVLLQRVPTERLGLGEPAPPHAARETRGTTQGEHQTGRGPHAFRPAGSAFSGGWRPWQLWRRMDLLVARLRYALLHCFSSDSALARRRSRFSALIRRLASSSDSRLDSSSPCLSAAPASDIPC